MFSKKIDSYWKYLLISLLCLVFFLVYDQFSHGVTSVYMTWLYLIPLGLGFFPVWARQAAGLPEPDGWTVILFQCGLATVLVSSLLRGILEIAGTSSSLQVILGFFGIILYGLSLAGYVLTITKQEK